MYYIFYEDMWSGKIKKWDFYPSMGDALSALESCRKERPELEWALFKIIEDFS